MWSRGMWSRPTIWGLPGVLSASDLLQSKRRANQMWRLFPLVRGLRRASLFGLVDQFLFVFFRVDAAFPFPSSARATPPTAQMLLSAPLQHNRGLYCMHLFSACSPPPPPLSCPPRPDRTSVATLPHPKSVRRPTTYPGTNTETGLNPFSTAIPIWGQTSLIPSELSPKQGWGPKRVNYY